MINSVDSALSGRDRSSHERTNRQPAQHLPIGVVSGPEPGDDQIEGGQPLPKALGHFSVEEVMKWKRVQNITAINQTAPFEQGMQGRVSEQLDRGPGSASSYGRDGRQRQHEIADSSTVEDQDSVPGTLAHFSTDSRWILSRTGSSDEAQKQGQSTDPDGLESTP